MSSYPDTVTTAAFGANDPALLEAQRRKQAEAQAAEQARLAAEQAKAAQDAAKAAQPDPNAAAVPASPVATPTSLGSRLMEAAQSGAQQGLASSSRNTTGGLVQGHGGSGIQEDVVDPLQASIEGAGRQAAATPPPPAPAPPAPTPPQVAPPMEPGSVPFGSMLNTNQGKGNEYAPGVSLGRQAMTPEDLARQQGASLGAKIAGKPEPAAPVAGYAVNRPAGADPANDLAGPPEDLPIREKPTMAELLKAAPELALPGELDSPLPGGPPPVDYSKMTAREEAKARLKGEGKDKRTGWQKLGIALSIAGDTLNAGKSNFTAKNMESSSPEKAEDKLTAIIQAERDRLQLRIDKGIEDTRKGQSFDLAVKKGEADIKNDTMNAETGRMNAETNRVNATNNAEDKRRDDVFRAERLADKNTEKKLRALPPGGILYEYDPISRRSVAIAQNNNAVTTTTENSEVTSGTDAEGKSRGSIRKDTKNVVTKKAGGQDAVADKANPALRETTLQRLARIKEERRLKGLANIGFTRGE